MPSAVSLRYARALVDTVTAPRAPEPAGDPRSVATELAGFQGLLKDNAELGILFSTPAISAAKKKAVLAELASLLGLTSWSRSFLQVVIDHDRMALLGEMAAAFDTLLDERLGIAAADITTARPLEEEEKRTLAEALRARTGKQVRMNFSLDPSLISGIVARVGSTIYDGSVRGLIERLRAQLVSG